MTSKVSVNVIVEMRAAFVIDIGTTYGPPPTRNVVPDGEIVTCAEPRPGDVVVSADGAAAAPVCGGVGAGCPAAGGAVVGCAGAVVAGAGTTGVAGVVDGAPGVGVVAPPGSAGTG